MRTSKKRVGVIFSGWIGEHCADANAVAFLDAIAEAGDSGPVVHFAARAEDMFLSFGAEKIRALRVIESGVVQEFVGERVAVRVCESRMKCGEPAIERDREEENRWLSGRHVIGVGR